MRTCLACGETVDEPTCPACGRPFVYRAWLPADEEDLEYDFDDVTPTERAEAADLLAGAGVVYRWDPGYVLRVAEADEERVDSLFGHDGEEATALKTLRTAAVALGGDPADEGVVADLADATGVVSAAEAPDGVNRIKWSTVGYLARQLLEVLDDGSPPEDVAAASAALIAVLS